MTYLCKQESSTIGGGHHQEVLDRRTSSRGVDRIKAETQSKAHGEGETALETVKSLPAGFDPIFNASSNATFTNENSHIKIKPMRRSKGFDSGEIS